ncbi:hypothetical protein CHU95_20190 [Niveispirillum lacus]|uniref:Uncharacterized protein n=1 Tax=Niveispirillum lacus TaxID=1981099 RepID=A0A255YQF9_9PROT|nr:hypothetical protein [Niveispirillum lacus]OYQ31473.1 hypothetical protein CHU95_20190 [Niveispirillum lacus]
MGYYDMVESCWQLSDAALDYVKKAGRSVEASEVWEKVFAPSPLVDHERTLRESPLHDKIFLKSPYGLQYRPDHKDWVPFRHGPVDLSNENNI